MGKVYTGRTVEPSQTVPADDSGFVTLPPGFVPVRTYPPVASTRNVFVYEIEAGGRRMRFEAPTLEELRAMVAEYAARESPVIGPADLPELRT